MAYDGAEDLFKRESFFLEWRATLIAPSSRISLCFAIRE